MSGLGDRWVCALLFCSRSTFIYWQRFSIARDLHQTRLSLISNTTVERLCITFGCAHRPLFLGCLVFSLYARAYRLNPDMCVPSGSLWSQRQLLSCMRGGNCPGPNVSSSQLPGDVSFFANQLAVPTVEFAFEQSKDDEVGPPKAIRCGHNSLVNKGPLENSPLFIRKQPTTFSRRKQSLQTLTCAAWIRDNDGGSVIVETHSDMFITKCLLMHQSEMMIKHIWLFPWHFHFIKYVMHSVSLKLE